MDKATKKEVLSSPLLKKGGQHKKSNKSERQKNKAKLKNNYGCQSSLSLH